MLFDTLRRRQFLQNTNAGTLTPVTLIKHTTDEKGMVTLLVPKFNNQRITKALEKNNKHLRMHLELDEMGSFVWKHIDNQTNVHNIIIHFKKIFPDTNQAEQRIITFITKMYHEKWITFKELMK